MEATIRDLRLHTAEVLAAADRGERVTITLSAGLTSFVSGESSEKVFERADQALYRAKSGGRNRVELG